MERNSLKARTILATALAGLTVMTSAAAGATWHVHAVGLIEFQGPGAKLLVEATIPSMIQSELVSAEGTLIYEDPVYKNPIFTPPPWGKSVHVPITCAIGHEEPAPIGYYRTVTLGGYDKAGQSFTMILWTSTYPFAYQFVPFIEFFASLSPCSYSIDHDDGFSVQFDPVIALISSTG